MLAMAAYDPDRIQGSVIDRAEVDRQIELYRTRDVDARHEIVGLQPKRADVILAGACIVRTIMDHGAITRWWDYWDMGTLMNAAPQWWVEHIMQGYE